MQGDLIVLRYCDDFIVGFQPHHKAERFLTDIHEQLRKVGLEPHPDKTRILEFGRFAMENRKWCSEKKPDTFNFLGFTHS